MSIALHISGTIHHMILIYGAHVKNNNIYFFHFFKILIFWVVTGVKEQKTTQNDKKSACRAPYLRNHTSDCHLWCTYVK